MSTVTLDTTSGSASGVVVVVVVVLLEEVVVGGIVVVVVGGNVVTGVVAVVEETGVVVVDESGADVVDESAVSGAHEETQRSSPRAKAAVFRTERSMCSSYPYPPSVNRGHSLSTDGRSTRAGAIPIDRCLSSLWLWASSFDEMRGSGVGRRMRRPRLAISGFLLAVSVVALLGAGAIELPRAFEDPSYYNGVRDGSTRSRGKKRESI